METTGGMQISAEAIMESLTASAVQSESVISEEEHNRMEPLPSRDARGGNIIEPLPSGDAKVDNMIKPLLSGEGQGGNLSQPLLSGERQVGNMSQPLTSGDAIGGNMSQPLPSGEGQVGNLSQPLPSGDAKGGNIIEPLPSGDAKVDNMIKPLLSGAGQGGNLSQPLLSGEGQGGNLSQPLLSGEGQGGNLSQPLLSGERQVGNMSQPLLSGDAIGDNMSQPLPSGEGQLGNLSQPLPSGDAKGGNMIEPLPSEDAKVGNMRQSLPSGDANRSNIIEPLSSGEEQGCNISEPGPSGRQGGNMSALLPSGEALSDNMSALLPSGEALSDNMSDPLQLDGLFELPSSIQRMHIHQPEDITDVNINLLVSSSSAPKKYDPQSLLFSSDVSLSENNIGLNRVNSEPAAVNQERYTTVAEDYRISTDSEVTIRDSSSSSGSREQEDAYHRFFEEFFPDYTRVIYKVPRVYFGNEPFSSKSRVDIQQSLGETTPVYLYEKAESAMAGDNAEKRVADFIERIISREFQENKWPAFIIMSYQFGNFCNKTDVLPQKDENKYVEEMKDSGVTRQKAIDGEHDLLIVHYKHGIIPIQVKSTKTATNPNNTVKMAHKQTEKDEDFFKANFKDLKLEKCIGSVIALPDITRQDLNANRLYKDCKSRLEDFGLSNCLFNNELVNKTEGDRWWSTLTSGKIGFKSLADYQQVLAKYIGYKSTVRIPVVNHNHNQTHPDGRKYPDCISAMGNRYMNIILTPEQVYILNCHLPRLVIHGQFGTGKTVLLILKVRSLLRKRKKVCVITVCYSPLEQVLKTSIIHQLNQVEIEGLDFKQARDQKEISVVLKECAKQGRHVFIDEFPSFRSKDGNLQATIKHYPKDLLIWCIMSRERNITLSRTQNEIFKPKTYPEQSQAAGNTVVSDVRNQTEERQGFIHLRMSKILRCPPTVHTILPSTTPKQEKQIAAYNDKTITMEGTQKRLASHFHSLGLTTPKINDVSNEPRNFTSLKWQDVVIFDKMRRSLQSTLKKLGVPLASSSWHTRANKAHYRTSRTGHDSFEHVACLPKNCCVYVREGVRLKCNNASALPKDDHKTKQQDEKGIAQLLFDHGFINENIEKVLEKSTTLNARDWSEILFVEETKPYAVLRDLGVAIVTPADDTYVNKVLYTTKHDFKGFSRKEVIVFEDFKAIANPSEDICFEGPAILRIDHTEHAQAIHVCCPCTQTLQKIIQNLGLIDNDETRANTVSGGGHLHPSVPDERRTSSQPTSVTENILAPRHNLTLADLLIVDVRQNPESIARLFQECRLPVVDKLNAEFVDVDDMFSSSSVMYVKPRMATGLEKKVVFVVRKRSEKLVSHSRCKIIEDPLMLACTRYTSQLVIITTN